jgi:hypothetical protein
MNSPLANHGSKSPDHSTGARFWRERKWHWTVEAALFAILAVACAFPIIAAGSAMVAIFQRLGV